MRYKTRPRFLENQWPPQVTKKFFNLALIRDESVRKGEVSNELTRLTMTGKVEDILKHNVQIKLHQVFEKKYDQKKMVVLFEGNPGSGKSALTLYTSVWSG